jgi:molecular chaperone GrpE
VQGRLGALEQIAEQVSRQQEFLPPQLRQLGHKVDDAATAITDVRIRDLLHSLVLLHDLVDQMRQAATRSEDHVEHQHNYEVLLRQILQMLQLNGVEPIATDGPFDATMHRGIKAVPTTDPAEAGRIVDVFRKGFRAPRMILRYAEVAVTRHEEQAAPSTDESDPPTVNGEAR